LMVEVERLEKHYGQAGFNVQHLKNQIRHYHDSHAIAQAMNPMFDDIADRKRDIYVQDFLIDTPSQIHIPTEEEPNLDETIALHFNPRLNWRTEGKPFSALLNDTGDKVELMAQCRAFWFGHSNGSLTYHLSLEINYEHSLAHFYALSALQKLVFPSEGTDDLQHETHLFSEAEPDQAFTFWAWFQRKFNGHAENLLTAFLDLDLATETEAPWTKLLALSMDEGRSHFPLPARRAIFLFKDKAFFSELHSCSRQSFSGSAIEPWADGTSVNDASQRVYHCPSNPLDALKTRAYFLSGFFQNIIDFFRQDASEVLDSTKPVYEDSHFLLYANPHCLYEVVSASRSLEGGRNWLGTCPYLLLVHIMAFHNETLVLQFEKKVSEIINNLEMHGFQVDTISGLSSRKMRKLLNIFREARLFIFQKVYKHMYSNVLRYETEQEFYAAIETIRGTRGRLNYWTDIMEKLEAAIDEIHQDERLNKEDRFNTIVLILSVSGVIQLAMQAATLHILSEAPKGVFYDRLRVLAQSPWWPTTWQINALLKSSALLFLATCIGLVIVRVGERLWREFHVLMGRVSKMKKAE
jgi:hypothetical protein